MLDVVHLLLGLLNLLSTWRFVACVLASVALFATAFAWLPVGSVRVVTLVASTVLGVGIGAIWQTRHERQQRKTMDIKA